MGHRERDETLLDRRYSLPFVAFFCMAMLHTFLDFQESLQLPTDNRRLQWLQIFRPPRNDDDSYSRRNGALSLLNSMNKYKQEESMWSQADDRPTLSKVHYLVLPVTWDGSFDEPANPSLLSERMRSVARYYSDQSWKKHVITWEILDQEVLTGISETEANFVNTKSAVQDIVGGLGRKQFDDYTGIIMIYNLAPNGPFSKLGGWGDVNGELFLLLVHENLIVHSRIRLA